ncbi:Uncharacterized protein TPAR_00335 [Tolypocladium paradoxum]|uniref:Uncharacterized protein n=1 Tax=Tolypocladium paradoxum TaxID=94208 RepID=A0A2S4LAL6_9HYPO|nr:Uncharacterized protein TPAR_00335 [Tolypocladium paradoxum]
MSSRLRGPSQLVAQEAVAAHVKGNGGGQAVDLLGDLHVASFDGAFEVDVADLLAEVRLGRNKSDEAVLDLLQGTLSGDLEVLVGDDIGGVAVEDAQRRRRCQAGGQAGDRKPHRVDVETVWRIAAAS